MSLKESVIQELDRLDDAKLQQVADYLAFLRFQSRSKTCLSDETTLAALYAEFAEEDRELAEEGMEDYVRGLTSEDKS
jgi:outer membrane protein assembly factor BamD (BamD/ComL family)